MNKILPIPEGLEVEETSQSLTISYRWYQPMVWFLIFFAVIWNGFLIFWFLADTPMIFKLFASLHVTVGIFLVWYIICMFFNKTVMIITKHEIEITHLPIPMPIYYKNMKLSRFDIFQVYITKTTNINKGTTTNTFELCAVSPKNATKKLSINCENYEKALFFKRKIEQFMRIEPQAVEGEYLGS